jgi:hypothetical protein
MANALVLHSRRAPAQDVPFERLAAIARPPRTPSYCPVAHDELVHYARNAIRARGIEIEAEQHSLTRDGQRYFGMMRLSITMEAGSLRDGGRTGLMVGLRNSYDKSLVVGMCVGFRVFVCDNLAFHGERVIARRHTTNILRELPSLMGSAVSDFLLPASEAIPATIARLDERVLTQEAYAATLLDLTRGGLVMPTELLAIDAEWRRGDGPGGVFPETGFTAWRLLNAITEVHKGSRASPGVLAGRTMDLSRRLLPISHGGHPDLSSS